MDAVVFDLFGTLVSAPTPVERAEAASRLAKVSGCDPSVVEAYFRDTWQVRHDGTLPTLADLAEHLARAVGSPDTRAVADELRTLAVARLRPDETVARFLKSLRRKGMTLGVLSDASAEIADAWPSSPLASAVESAVFSCRFGAVKPDPQLFARVQIELNGPAHRMLYVGDGGGDELRGAVACGMTAVAVRRRGPRDALAFGVTDWTGDILDGVEQVPSYLARFP